MKIEELMIGDWVRLENHYQGKPVKIIGIEGEMVKIEHERYWCTALLPVSLTAEILEKNGFKRTGVYEKYEWCSRHSEIWVIIGDTNEAGEQRHCVHIDSWRREIPTEYHNAIIYVHELQHALRLCGIEKEITLTI